QRGGLVYVSGRIRTRQFTDAEGVVRFSTSVHADVLRMLGGRPHDDAPAPEHVPDGQSTPGRRARRAAATQAATEPEHLLDDDQDDIPF
ncbi:MAG: single-stranded DNA-binding protein, partial [Lautropia sp.]